MNNHAETTGAPGIGDEQSNEAGAGQDANTRTLLRSSSDRLVVGVAGGLGRYFDVDPVMFRIDFAISVLFGGTGLLAYAMLALFVPTDGEPDEAQRLGHRLQAALNVET